MTVKFSIRKDSWTVLRDILKSGQEFTASNLNGEVGKCDSAEQLNAYWKAQYERSEVTYTIRSYDTPIAWKTAGEWIVVDQTFSSTTTKHQGKVRTALFALEASQSY